MDEQELKERIQKILGDNFVVDSFSYSRRYVPEFALNQLLELFERNQFKKEGRYENLISIGWNKKGELDFGIRATIGELSFEQMQELRAMIVVAIGTAEDMWRKAKEKENPASQETSK